MAQPSYLSREGLENLKPELQHLRTVRRHDIAERIQQSRERGGTVSNAEYEEAKNELGFTEERILTLDNMINNAVIIEENQGGRDTVEVGTTIAVMDQDGRPFRYTIVGSAEADPSQRNDIQRFSHRPKPVGKTGRRCSRGQRPVGRNQARSIGN